MRLPLIFVTSSLVALLISCSGLDPKARADAICDCLRELERLNLNLTQSIASGEEEAVTDLLLEISRSAGEARTCLQELGVTGGEDLRSDSSLRALLDQQCPAWAAMLDALPPE